MCLTAAQWMLPLLVRVSHLLWLNGAEHQRGDPRLLPRYHRVCRAQLCFYFCFSLLKRGINMSNKQVSTGRRSAKRRPPTSRWNFGFGRRLDYAASVALDKFFGHTSHFNTRHTHKRRLEVFMNFCMRHGIQDARTIDQEIIQRFCQYVVARIQGDYQWPEGDTERPISIAYAHNLLSTMNISLWALRGDNRLR